MPYRTQENLEEYRMRNNKNVLLSCSPDLAGIVIAKYVSITAFLCALTSIQPRRNLVRWHLPLTKHVQVGR